MKEGYGPASVAVVSIDARLRRVADLDRNTRPLSTGTGGRNEPESVADLKRNQWPNWAGICTPDGGYWSPSHFSRMFTFHARRLGIHCRLHDLRHSHATHMLKAGVHPKVVSERLGHAKVGFTLDTYVHAVEGLDADAARKIGAALQVAMGKAGRREG